jgi:WD40 repeat protein
MEVFTSDLRSLAEDCLRFTMHFFHLIRKSAPHIYHSALPLSPGSSTFRSRTLNEKTKISKFHGRPDAWGIVVRTITASPKRFTCMTTFGHRIAAVCDDDTVNIYDSITGVLRLSLSPPKPIRTIRGSPDGSVLFCAHKSSSITAWDMQTGGLIHTFLSDRNAEDIAVSLKGRYLACGLPDSSVEVWEVDNEMEGAAIWTSSSATHFCWLEPEEQLAISTRALVHVWDIAAGTTLWSFPTRFPVYHMIYSQKLHLLALVASLTPETVITLINPQTGKSTSNKTHQTFSCFAFSQNTEELVCGMETPELQLFNVSTRCWRRIEYPDIMTSASSLQNGTVVAITAGSSIQLLSLDEGHIASQHSNISALTVQSLDQGEVIAVLPTNRNYTVLLELATMKRLLKIASPKTHMTPTVLTHILCASLRNHIAVYSFNEGGKEYMQLWEFHEQHPKWTTEIDGQPSTGGISPSGAQAVVIYDMYNQTCISLWDAQTGQLRAKLQTGFTFNPHAVGFPSETEFSLHRRSASPVAYTISSQSTTPGHSITGLHMTGIGVAVGEQWMPYDVDDACEWVVSGSERICWIPPGYIGSVQRSYCWAGSSLFMAGQDGNLRRFLLGALS